MDKGIVVEQGTHEDLDLSTMVSGEGMAHTLNIPIMP